jgi:hypothetical protein
MGAALSVRVPLVAALCALLASCATADGSKAAQSAADATTKAVYADDYTAVISNFDDAIKGRVSRIQVAALSDELHSLGAYKGIAYIQGDPVKEEYTYRLLFQHGTMSLVVRLDPRGLLAAYRLVGQS